MILSTISWMGGKNPFLGIAYITVGSVCFFLGVVLLIIHHKCGNRSSSADISNWAAAARPPAPPLAPPPLLIWLSSLRGVLLVNSVWRWPSSSCLRLLCHVTCCETFFELFSSFFFIHHCLFFSVGTKLWCCSITRRTHPHTALVLCVYISSPLRTVLHRWITVSPAHSAAWLASVVVVVVVVVGAAAHFLLLTVTGVTGVKENRRVACSSHLPLCDLSPLTF